MEDVEAFADTYDTEQGHGEMYFNDTENKANENDKLYATAEGDIKVIPAPGKYRIPRSTRFVA